MTIRRSNRPYLQDDVDVEHRRSRRPFVEDVTAIDARQLHDAGLFPRAHRHGTLGGLFSWSSWLHLPNGPTAWAVTELDVDSGDGGLLVEMSAAGHEVTRVRLRLSGSPQPLGGWRWWIVCPLCRRRRVAAYLHDGRWGCVGCLRLRYRTTALGAPQRRLLVARRRLARHEALTGLPLVVERRHPLSPRAFAAMPRGSWPRTRERIRAELLDAIEAESRAFGELIRIEESRMNVGALSQPMPAASAS